MGHGDVPRVPLKKNSRGEFFFISQGESVQECRGVPELTHLNASKFLQQPRILIELHDHLIYPVRIRLDAVPGVLLVIPERIQLL